VWVERTEKPYVLALRKSDGSETWKVDGLGSTSWGSPRLIAVGGTEHLVLSASGNIVGLNPANGKRLWSFDNIQGNTTATPIPIGEGQFMIGSSGNRNGEVTKPCCGVIQIESIDNAFFADWVWSSRKLTCSFGSPIAHDGKAYFVNRSGIVQCQNLETGDPIFKGRLPSGSIWATPLATESLVYFFGKNGVTTIVEPGSELKIVTENRLWPRETKPSPASKDPKSKFSSLVLYAATAVGNRLLLRRGDRLYACQSE
jgi:outer membrane protein assembly factor BamB